jgi:hypothetical protein
MSANDSYFIDRAACEKAVQLSQPMIHAAMESRVAGESGFLYVVIMNPCSDPATSSFEQAILFEQAVFGDKEKWDADYGEFARAKAKIAWKTGLDGHIVQEIKPYLLGRGDTVLWGSVVIDGITVAVSGADAWFDEAFAGTIAMCLRALAKQGIAKARKKALFLRDE